MNKYLLASLVILTIFLSSSCRKSKEKKIVGDWTFVPMNSISDPANEQVWTFDASNKIKIEVKYTDTTYYYSGTYEVLSKFMKGNYVDIRGVYIYWNGLYKIKELKSDVMVLNRVEKNADSENPDVEGGAFLWKEFVKK